MLFKRNTTRITKLPQREICRMPFFRIYLNPRTFYQILYIQFTQLAVIGVTFGIEINTIGYLVSEAFIQKLLD